MFYIYDNTEKKALPQHYSIKSNADRNCQKFNIKKCGIEEIDKPQNERRYVVKGVKQ